MKRILGAPGPWPPLLVATIGIAVLLGSCARDQPGADGAGPETEIESTVGLSVTVDLYFPSENADLRREPRELSAAADVAGRIRQIVEALLAGPERGGLYPPLPDDVVLAAAQFTSAGIAYLDFEAGGRAEPPPFGSRGELLAVYSIVDSVLLNVTEVRSVVLLWNGTQQFSLAGHVDTSAPLTANRTLIGGD